MDSHENGWRRWRLTKRLFPYHPRCSHAPMFLASPISELHTLIDHVIQQRWKRAEEQDYSPVKCMLCAAAMVPLFPVTTGMPLKEDYGSTDLDDLPICPRKRTAALAALAPPITNVIPPIHDELQPEHRGRQYGSGDGNLSRSRSLSRSSVHSAYFSCDENSSSMSSSLSEYIPRVSRPSPRASCDSAGMPKSRNPRHH